MQSSVQVLPPNEQQARPPQQPQTSGGIGSWLWGTMAGPATPAPPTAPPTAQQAAPSQPTLAEAPTQAHSPTPLNETQAPQQPHHGDHQEQERAPLQESDDSRPSSSGSRHLGQASAQHDSSTYDTASSQDVDAAARHAAFQQAYASHQTQVRNIEPHHEIL